MGASFSSGVDTSKGCPVGKHIEKASDITDFPIFPAEVVNNMVKTELTRDVWEKCIGKKDMFGSTIQQQILSGCHNLDSSIGVYAASHHSYYVFAPLYDKVIEKYHGHKKTDKHVSDMDYTKLQCPPFPADEDKMINSTRIRVARNLADYPLGAGCTREQRNEIEQKVIEATSKYTGEL